MKNAKKYLGLLVIALVVCTLATGLVACNKGSNLDPETRAFSMSIQEPDGVFNPFFSTSAYDSNVISLTQISMFNTNAEGSVIAGLDQPTVALDYNYQTKDRNGNPEYNEANAVYTDYDILIKNGIKFSDGSPLTIQDVLFNLYVYLDPVFTGSATIYSTDIVGLSAYRTQQGGLSEQGAQNFENQFDSSAGTRLNRLIAWVKYVNGDPKDNPNKPSHWNGHTWDSDYSYKETEAGKSVTMSFEMFRNYVDHVASLYMDELNSDWNAINLEEYNRKAGESEEEETGFTEPWQVFAVNDMGMTELLVKLSPTSGVYRKTPNGKVILDVEAAQSAYDKITRGKGIENLTGLEKETAIRKAFIESQFGNVFQSYTTETDEYGTVSYKVRADHINHKLFTEVVSYWATADKLYEELVAEVKSTYFGSTTLNFPNISGITVSKVRSFDGKMYNHTDYSDEHYVLHIRINKVDPKALMNFAFTVAPMKYYSDPDAIKDFNEDFQAWEAAGANPDTFNDKVSGVTHFGVRYADSSFMNDVVNSSSRVTVPIGAGPYQASSQNTEEDVTKVKGSDFKNANMIYYVRNKYFWTVGADGGDEASSKLHNAYIKKVLYKVVASDQIINALSGNNIDFGDPSATQRNTEELERNGLEVVREKTAGYGYIGINPRYVPELGVRRAIMKAMDIDGIINGYYYGGFAERIYRPMSTTSWAYPKGAGIYYWGTPTGDLEQDNYIGLDYDPNGAAIRKLVTDAGYHFNENTQLFEKNGTNETLDIKFTIAGGSVDHPAYDCFLNAQKILNENGFNVQVVTSAQALSDLSAGKLAVWAAAWSSAIDPDMYQVYHINSQASSTSNWGYKQIKADTKTYSTEYTIIQSLSKKIDEAREVTSEDQRKPLYAEALDLVMQLSVELPTYQRYDISAFNAKVIDKNSLPKYEGAGKETSPYYGLLSRIWDVKYV